MKVKSLVAQLYEAIVNKDAEAQKRIYAEILQKSLKGKKTHAVR